MKELNSFEMNAVSGAGAAEDLSAFGKNLGGIVDKITEHLPIPYNIHHDKIFEAIGTATGSIIDTIFGKLTG